MSDETSRGAAATAPPASGPRVCSLPEGLDLVSGRRLEHVDIAYETWGELDEDGDNAILICHALSGDATSLRARTRGASTNPAGGRSWSAPARPSTRTSTSSSAATCSAAAPARPDRVRSTRPPRRPTGCDSRSSPSRTWSTCRPRLLDRLGVEKLLAVVGGSMGGMQALAWTERYPERVRTCIGVATTPRLGAQAIAFQRGGPPGHPRRSRTSRAATTTVARSRATGSSIARMIGHITYLSDESMHEKFGRRLRHRDDLAFDFVTEFEVESYLAHQGRKFVERFDANTYLYMTKSMDYFDLAAGHDSVAAALAGTPVRFLLLTFSSDWLFPTYQTQGLVDAIRAREGPGQLRRDPQPLRPRRVPARARGAAPLHRAVPHARALRGARGSACDGERGTRDDGSRPVACRSSARHLARAQGQPRARSGLQRRLAHRAPARRARLRRARHRARARGHRGGHRARALGGPVRPRRGALRLSRPRLRRGGALADAAGRAQAGARASRDAARRRARSIVTFPNFGHWRVRGYLALKGRMPVSESIPFSWYDTPNIHHTTLKDFRDFVAANGGEIEREIPLSAGEWRRDSSRGRSCCPTCSPTRRSRWCARRR